VHHSKHLIPTTSSVGNMAAYTAAWREQRLFGNDSAWALSAEVARLAWWKAPLFLIPQWWKAAFFPAVPARHPTHRLQLLDGRMGYFSVAVDVAARHSSSWFTLHTRAVLGTHASRGDGTTVVGRAAFSTSWLYDSEQRQTHFRYTFPHLPTLDY